MIYLLLANSYLVSLLDSFENFGSASRVDFRVFKSFENAMLLYVYFLFLQAILAIGAPTYNHSTDLTKRAQTVLGQCPIPGALPFIQQGYIDALAAVSLNKQISLCFQVFVCFLFFFLKRI
jgi:hypothetical protein